MTDQKPDLRAYAAEMLEKANSRQAVGDVLACISLLMDDAAAKNLSTVDRFKIPTLLGRIELIEQKRRDGKASGDSAKETYKLFDEFTAIITSAIGDKAVIKALSAIDHLGGAVSMLQQKGATETAALCEKATRIKTKRPEANKQKRKSARDSSL